MKRLLAYFYALLLLLLFVVPSQSADLSITAANVTAGTGAVTINGTAKEAVTAGQLMYLDAASGQYKLSANATTGRKTLAGIALNNAAAGQPIVIQTSGQVNLGSVATTAVIYTVSSNQGGIAPSTDNATGQDIIIFGVAVSASVIQINTFIPGATHP
jgi:hypothetical protein